MSKEITLGKASMEAMISGLDKAANAVKGTLSPRGRNVYLMDATLPSITNDGVTVASKIILADPKEDAGAYVIRNVTGQTNDDVGDGTTTTAVLTQAIIHECLKRPENAMLIKQSLKEAGDKVLKTLADLSTPLNPADIEKVASISSEDKHIAGLITEIFNKLGKEAVVNVENSKTFATEYEIVDGYEAHVGFMSPHFVTDRKSNRAIYENVPVLISEKKISNISDIAPIFEMFKKEGIGQCVIVCEDIDDAMLGVLVQNKLMGTFNSLVIRATGWLLQDIEGAVGARAISDSTGVTFKSFTRDQLGVAKQVVCDANKTVFTTDGVAAKQYASLLDMQAENEPNMYQAEKLKHRAAKMRGGVAVLRIGASTDFERDYLRLKAEDSVKAVQAALAEGIVEGGGMTFWRIAQDLKPDTIGDTILKAALTAPLRTIIENSGKDYTEVISQLPPGEGYNAKDDCYEPLIAGGIIDPSKVERCALENAVSAASTFISTFALITEVPDVKN